jgi:hypothetical protein
LRWIPIFGLLVDSTNRRSRDRIGQAKQDAGGGSVEGWKQIVKHVAKTLLESKNLRGQAEAANFLDKVWD